MNVGPLLAAPMTTSEPKPRLALGFFTVIENKQHGLLGGYLVLNCAGRPLEFHCTSGVRPNRAQAILFGPTLDAYLYGEQIGQTLLSKSSLAPAVICTNRPQALAVRSFVDRPVVLVEREGLTSEAHRAGAILRIDSAHQGIPTQLVRKRGADRVFIAPAQQSDCAHVDEFLNNLADGFDLSEPFDRIESAIDEAQRSAK